jgi:hypothetical protein
MVLVTPFMVIGYWWSVVLVVGALCLVLVCIGKPKAALEVIRAIPLVPPGLRGLLIPPRTGLAQRAFRAITRWW